MQDSLEEKLGRASQLIKAKRFDEAREILETIAHDGTAQKWLAKLDEIAPKGKRKNDDDDDPFAGMSSTGGYDSFGESAKPKREFVPPPKDYTGLAILILFLYWLLWFPGLIANIYYLNEANEYKRNPGADVSGMGCLWALLIFNVIPIIACCGLLFISILAGPDIEQVFDNIIGTLGVTPTP